MTRPELGGRFLDSTRGRVFQLLRREPRTVEELARALGLTDNAIRAHLVSLERDGLVLQKGVRRGVGAGKPASVYELHPRTSSLSGAYVPVLRAVLEELASRLQHEDRSDEAMRAVGRRLASALPIVLPAVSDRSAATPAHARLAEAALAVLAALGGEAEVDVADGLSIVRGCTDCPLGGAVSSNPELCRAIESLLSEVAGADVKSVCQHGDRPRCAFEIRAVA